MRKVQKENLGRAVKLLEQAMLIISEVRFEEQNKFDNLSETLQEMAGNAKLEDNALFLEDIETNIAEQSIELETFIKK